MTTPKRTTGQLNSPFPFPLNVNGNQPQQPATPQTFWDNLNNWLQMRAGVGVVNQMEHQDGGKPSRSPVEDMAALAQAFGFNLPAMQQRQDTALLELNKAQTEAQRAKADSELQSVRNEFQNLKDYLQQPTPEDPLREMLMKKALEEDPLTTAARAQFISRLTALPPEQPSLTQQLRELKTLENELRGVFAPPPSPAADIGMVKEQLYSIELKRLEMQERLDLKRIEKEYDAATAQAAAWKEIVNTVANFGGQIGEFIVNRMMPAGAVPAALAPGQVVQDDTPAATLKCPDCGQQSVIISQEVMAALTETNKPQLVTCSNPKCKVEHELTPPDSGPAAQPTQNDTPAADDESDIERDQYFALESESPDEEPEPPPPPLTRRNAQPPLRPGFNRLAEALPDDTIRKG